jgi:hypothetical protein
MEPEGSLVYTQELTTSPYHEPDKSSSPPLTPNHLRNIHFINILLSKLCLQRCLFFRFVHQNSVCIFVPPVSQAPPLLYSFKWSPV